MNILFFYLPAIAPERGGVERVTSVLADEFERLGHHCFYLATLDENRDAENPKRQFYLPNLSRADAPENLNFYKKLISEKAIDVVVFQGGHKKFPWAKFDGHPPLICALHLDPCAYETIVKDKAEFRLKKYAPLMRTLLSPIWKAFLVPAKTTLRRLKKNAVYRWNYRQCDAYVVLSAAYCKSLARHLKNGDESAKISFIPNPCTYPPQEETFRKEKILLYVGRLCMNQKRPDLMLDVWERLEKDFPDWSLEMLGDGDDADEVKALAKEKKLERVHFRGFVPPEPFFRKAPFLCMTSSNEGFPMVLLEASTFGCVPVAFDAFPTARDIITDGENGILVAPLNVSDYVETLKKLMKKDDVVRPEACRENARRYSMTAVGERWLELFEKLIRK